MKKIVKSKNLEGHSYINTVKSVERNKKYGLKIKFYKLVRLILAYLPHSLSYFTYMWKRRFPGYVIKEINGMKMFLDLRADEGISRALYLFSKREGATVDYLINSKILKKGDVVLDIGSNIGYYALLESKLVGRKGIVYAIEPVSTNYYVLQKNISLNNLNNINTYQLAAGPKNGSVLINVSKSGNQSSIYFHSKLVGRLERKEKVKMVRIDDFLKNKKRPNLIRMDLEGYEYEVIKGMEKTLESDVKILLELHPDVLSHDEIKDMFHILQKHGFNKSVVIFYLYPLWANKHGEARQIIKVISRKIGNMEGLESAVKSMSLDDLLDLLREREYFIHALIFKG